MAFQPHEIHSERARNRGWECVKRHFPPSTSLSAPHISTRDFHSYLTAITFVRYIGCGIFLAELVGLVFESHLELGLYMNMKKPNRSHWERVKRHFSPRGHPSFDKILIGVLFWCCMHRTVSDRVRPRKACQASLLSPLVGLALPVDLCPCICIYLINIFK